MARREQALRLRYCEDFREFTEKVLRSCPAIFVQTALMWELSAAEIQRWRGGGKKFFEDRFDSLLKKIHDKNVIVINASTKGHKNRRKDIITGCIKEKNLQVYEVDHPASWRIPQILLK